MTRGGRDAGRLLPPGWFRLRILAMVPPGDRIMQRLLTACPGLSRR